MSNKISKRIPRWVKNISIVCASCAFAGAVCFACLVSMWDAQERAVTLGEKVDCPSELQQAFKEGQEYICREGTDLETGERVVVPLILNPL